MIRLAVFDIDGTLVPFDTHVIAAETVQALAALQRRGVRTAIATGRQWPTLHPELKALGFDYYILSNGSYLTDREGRVLHSHGIDDTTVAELTRDFIERGHPLVLRYLTGNKSANPNEDILPYSADFFSPEQLQKVIEMTTDQEKLDHSGEQPVACMGHIEPEEKPYFDAKYPGLHFMITGGGKLCDINKAGVSKATGMEDICACMGLDPSEAIAFGDDGNDVELIRRAGIGVAMSNAVPEVLTAADYVTARCEDLGVVKALAHFGLLA